MLTNGFWNTDFVNYFVKCSAKVWPLNWEKHQHPTSLPQEIVAIDNTVLEWQIYSRMCLSSLTFCNFTHAVPTCDQTETAKTTAKVLIRSWFCIVASGSQNSPIRTNEDHKLSWVVDCGRALCHVWIVQESDYWIPPEVTDSVSGSTAHYTPVANSPSLKKWWDANLAGLVHACWVEAPVKVSKPCQGCATTFWKVCSRADTRGITKL